MTTNKCAQYTPPAGCFQRLMDLKDALDHVQPLADYRGNFEAIHAALVMLRAMDAVRRDFAFLDESAA